MKARTKIQREVANISATLPPITQRQKDWAITHVFKHAAFLCKNTAWCSCCGGTFSADTSQLSVAIGVTSKTTCPHCGAMLKYECSRRQKTEENSFYMIITAHKGWQICRIFVASKYMRRGGQPFYEFQEAIQNYINPDGKEVIIARPLSPSCFYYNKWNFTKPMEIRRAGRNRNGIDIYHPTGVWTYPRHSLLPIIKRNGYTARCDSIPQAEFIKMLLTDNIAETLCKTRQYDLLSLRYQRGHLPFKHAIRIANRNKYIVTDASMWIDYLRLLEFFRLDTHNAHYICPKNLKAEHDRLMARKRRVEQQQKAEEIRMAATEREERYHIDKKNFLSIAFTDGDIHVHVLQSVAEFAEEGDKMHHCVFTNEYYKKYDSLILSARDKDGNRLETIEVNPFSGRIIQSRGACNSITSAHKRIITLVNKNMSVIQRAAHTKTTQ